MRDLSCDIAVEHMIDGMNYRSIRFSRSLLRRETYRLLEKEGKTLNAQRVYKILSEWNLNEKDLTNLEQEFRTDDHRYWESKKPDQKPNPMLSANGGRSMMESRRIWKPFPRKQVSGTEISWSR